MKYFSLSLRFKIMICVSAVTFMIIISFYGFILMNRLSINTMGNSYTSNAKLNILQKNLSDLEYYLEVYNDYKTYESIDNYYSYRIKVEDFTKSMQNHPSSDPLAQKEYTVKNLASSFVYYSGLAVSQKRANTDNKETFEKALRCYRTLQTSLTELNTMMMESNANLYINNKKQILRMTEQSVIFYIIYFLFLLAFLYLLITKIVQPLEDISKVAETLAERNFDIPLFERKGNDEIA